MFIKNLLGEILVVLFHFSHIGLPRFMNGFNFMVTQFHQCLNLEWIFWFTL